MLIRDFELAVDCGLARDLFEVQRAAYACEAALIGDDRIPPLHEGLEDLLQAPLRWIGAFAEGQLLGALAYVDEVDHLDVDRLVVEPHAHRRGIGSALVHEVLQRVELRRALVSTGRANYPARTLYERLGFLRIRDEEVLPDLWVTRYEYGIDR